MRTLHLVGTVATLALSTLVVVACSSPAIPNDVGGQQDQEQVTKPGKSSSSSSSGGSSSGSTSSSSGSTSSSGGSSSSSGSTSSSSSGGPDPATCAKQSGEACFECCFEGVDTTAIGQAEEACICGATGACKSECGSSLCAGKAPTAACDTCLNGSKAQKCWDASDAACSADPACAAASTCANSCPQ